MKKIEHSKILYVLKSTDDGFILVISEKSGSSEGVVIQRKQITQTHVIYQSNRTITINFSDVIEKIHAICIENKGNYLFTKNTYNNIIYELNRKEQILLNNEEDQSKMNSEEDEDEQQESSLKESREQKMSKVISYEMNSSDDLNKKNQNKRGRPKGSKNKKTIFKELTSKGAVSLEMFLANQIRRGKGRPKGSRNRHKLEDEVKLQQSQNHKPFGSRGKGRPKGSKNRIKVMQNQLSSKNENQDKQKRGPGRPKGAKNKLNSTPSYSIQNNRQSQQQIVNQYLLPQAQEWSNLICCSKCYQNSLKRRIMQGEIQTEDFKQQLANLSQDYSPENNMNVLIEAIKLGDWTTLDILLSIIHQRKNYFKPPWQLDRCLQKIKYKVKTRKQFLSKTGKQGIYALMHDQSRKKQIWWQQLTVQRIIQNLPRNKDGLQILKRLVNHSSELKKQIYNNVSSLIRNGNTLLAQLVLRHILMTPENNKFNYSQEHYDVLEGNPLMINKLKKFSLIKRNDGPNYCSPVHCAAITNNPDFLEKLLQNFTDIINVEDSMLRKPIHYASLYPALSPDISNLRILVENGADLKEYDRKRITPLMLSCQEGQSLNVNYILEKVRQPQYINFKSDEGYTALHYAILNNHKQCVQMLINDPLVNLQIETGDQEDIFHLLAAINNQQILELVLNKNISLIFSQDKFKRTPAIICIKNHNNQMLHCILQKGCKPQRADSSQNTLLHYAAAYGNVWAIVYLMKNKMIQMKNKHNLYPWQIAIMKGHIGCAKLLDKNQIEPQQDPLYLILTNIRGSQQYLDCVKYIESKFTYNINYQQKLTGNGYMHLVCSLGQQQYCRTRKSQTHLSLTQIKDEFIFIENELLDFLLNKGLVGTIQNKKKESPLKLCIQNCNLIGFEKLLNGKINFDLESSSGITIMHCLSNLACKGYQQMKFVQNKLKQSPINQLRINLKKIDHNGFDFLLYFVKNFTQSIKQTFRNNVKQLLKKNIEINSAQKQSFYEFEQYQKLFMKLVIYLAQMGCDLNGQVSDHHNNSNENYKKWGIPHFLMRFPSLKLIKFFKYKIRDFNTPNNKLMTPLHLFCKNIHKGNLLDIKIQIETDYQAENILAYLLSIGLNPNCQDIDKALPMLYAAVNNQYSFIIMLRQHKSRINFCSASNKVPLIEIIRNSGHYTLQQIQKILKIGADPNFIDMDKRNALHHLVVCSQNFDTSPQVCKLLLDYQVRVNAVDKYGRSPIFYCFTKMQAINQCVEEQTNDRVEILQVLMNMKDINLNLLDLFQRSLVHYACQRDYFFSILYLLDKNINIEAKDYQQNTPLAVSLKNKNLDQAALIIKRGVKFGYVNECQQKMSYFLYAIKKLSVGLCFMLLDNGYPIQNALQEVTNQRFKQILLQKYIK